MNNNNKFVGIEFVTKAEVVKKKFVLHNSENIDSNCSFKKFRTMYQSTNSLPYPSALYAIQKKFAIGMRLPEWNPGIRIEVYNEEPQSRMPYLYKITYSGKVPWLGTFFEMFRNDWELIFE